MIKVKDIYNFIDAIAPFNYCMDFDNCGILVGDCNAGVRNVLLTLDVTNEVVEEAVSKDANLIISHHPVIFNPVKKITSNSVVHNLIKNDITVISAHTNLDMADNIGVNACLASVLNLSDVRALSFYKVDDKILTLGLVGELDSTLNAEDFAYYVKDKLGCNGLRYFNHNDSIKTVAVCSGAGGNLIFDAIEKNADAFVTGEIKHHEILIAEQYNVTVIDAGHFKTEDIVIKPLMDKLKEKFTAVNFMKSQAFFDKSLYIK